MNRELRILRYEVQYHQLALAVKRLSQALDAYEETRPAVKALDGYLGSDTWKADREADEQGLLPEGLARGVLSEDGLWNLLEEVGELDERLRNLITYPAKNDAPPDSTSSA